MRIAVAYDNGSIFEMYNESGFFAIYDFENADVNKCRKHLVEVGEDKSAAALARLLKQEQAEVVICGMIDAASKGLLLSSGIIPLAGYRGNADIAADMLIEGTLPMFDAPGGCSGSCAGCSGCGGDEGDCGCDGGCCQ